MPNQLLANSIFTLGMALSPEDKAERLQNLQQLATQAMDQVAETSPIISGARSLAHVLTGTKRVQAPELYDPKEFFQREDVQSVLQQGYFPTDVAIHTFIPGEFETPEGFSTAKGVLADMAKFVTVTDPLLVFGVGRAAARKAVLGPQTYEYVLKNLFSKIGGAIQKTDEDERFKGSILE